MVKRLKRGGGGGWGGGGGGGGCGGGRGPQPSHYQHSPQRNLQPSLRRDHDLLLRRNRRREALGQPHGLGDRGGIGQLVVPLLEGVAIRPDALRQDLIDQRHQRAVRPRQGAEVLHLKHEAPELLGVGVLRRPAPRQRADRRQKVTRVRG